VPISGSSPNKSFSRTDGTRTGSTVWQASAAASRGIQATDNDFHDNDVATAINSCLFRDGGNAATGNWSMGGFKLTGLGTGSTSGDSVEYAQMYAAIAAAMFPSGTVMSFFQAAAPTGWTQVTTYNDAALRVVSGTGGGSRTVGQAFSTAVAGGTVDGTSISKAQLPSYNLTVNDPGHAHTISTIASVGAASGGSFLAFGPYSGSKSTDGNTTGISVSSGGSGQSHNHTFTSSQFGINYIDMILAAKN